METFPIRSTDVGVITAFEIENAYVGPVGVAKILVGADGVSEVRQRKPFSAQADVHVEFMYRGHDCVVIEPFGDNSRYWIGPKESGNSAVDFAMIEAVFKAYRPPLLRRILGDLLSLKFLK